MKTPHKHAELIKAWADGAEIQFKTLHGQWIDVVFNEPSWSSTDEYRIKPEPKPDVVRYVVACINGLDFLGPYNININNNLRLTFDGETGALKAAEVLS